MSESVENELRSRAQGHPALLAVIEYWCQHISNFDIEEEFPRYIAQLDQVRASIDAVEPWYRQPAAPQRAAAEKIASRFDDPERAWRACIDAELIPPDWIDDPARRFFDEHGNDVAVPQDMFEVVALASDRDGVLAAEACFRRIARALAPWGHREPEVLYWFRFRWPFDIQSGCTAIAYHAINAEAANALYGERPDTRESIDAAAIASMLWRDPETRLDARRVHPSAHGPRLLEEFHRRATATLPDPFSEMLALLRTGYGFELQGSAPDPYLHALLIPDDQT